METKPSVERNGFTIGLITSAALVAYFFIMKAAGLEKVLELRFFNFIIAAIGIAYGINKLKNDLNQDEFYLKGWAQGIYISTVCVVSFSIFMSIYIMYFDPTLLESIRENTNIGASMNTFTLFISLIMEGMAGGAIITFAAMQYLKRQGSNVNYGTRQKRKDNKTLEKELEVENWRL